jgi:hypothetical protein
MGKATEPVDGTDVNKERWWEQERTVFKGRADSFIARMRLVQGIRSNCWIQFVFEHFVTPSNCWHPSQGFPNQIEFVDRFV